MDRGLGRFASNIGSAVASVLQAAGGAGPPAGVAAARQARYRGAGRDPDRCCRGGGARRPFGGRCARFAGRAGLAVPVHHRSWAVGLVSLSDRVPAAGGCGGSIQPALPNFSRNVLAAISVRLGFIFMAIAVPGLFVAIVKRLIGRARPFVAGEDAWTSQLLVWRPDYASFPSGHATTAFAAAVAIGALWPRLRPVMWTYAVVIAVSRVIVTAHHPSDVIAGAIAGAIGALLVRNWYAARRLGFAVRADGTVFKLPGPVVAARQSGCPAAGLCLERGTKRHRQSTWSKRQPILPSASSFRCATKPAMSRRWWPRSPRRWTGAGATRSSTSTTDRPTAPRRSSAR